MSDANWRTQPDIQEAKRVAAALGATTVILLVLDEPAGTIRLATFGTSRAHCRVGETLGEVAYDAVMAVLEAS